MLDYPRLREPLLAALAAAVFILAAWRGERLPDWFRLLCVAFGVIFLATALVTALDFLTYRISRRMYELSTARTAGMRELASALHGLSTSQTDLVASGNGLIIRGLLGERSGPVYTLKCVKSDVPMQFVADFLGASQDTAPYLFPVNRAGELGEWKNAVHMAQDITNILVANGLAKPAGGPYPAILTEELATVATMCGVEL